MSGKFRNNLQAAVLFDGHADVWPSLVLDKFRMAMLDKGMPWQIVQENKTGVLMFGPYDLQLTCTYYDRPAEHAVFSQVLNSPVTRMLFPDAERRVKAHRSHVLVELQQGVFGGVEDDPKIASMFETIGFPRAGRDLGSFNRRVDVLAEACLTIHKADPASAVHWTQSNTLIAGEKMEALLRQTEPGLLTIHPMMFGGEKMPGFKEMPVEIYTIGAADYIGREIHTDLAPISWLSIYDGITAFVRLATLPNGYIIPDGDTFGNEAGEFSWLVTHLDGTTQRTVNGQPYYNLKLLYDHRHGYTAPDFKGRQLLQGGVAEASSFLQGSEQARQEQIADWEKSQERAQRAGGRFQIFRKTEPAETAEDRPAAPPPTPPSPAANLLTRVFGKRKS